MSGRGGTWTLNVGLLIFTILAVLCLASRDPQSATVWALLAIANRGAR